MKYTVIGNRNAMSYMSLGLVFVTPVLNTHSSNFLQASGNFFLSRRYFFRVPTGMELELYITKSKRFWSRQYTCHEI